MADGDSIPDALETRVGPLPVGAWLAAAAAGVVVGILLLRRRRSSSTPAGEPETPATADAAGSPFLPSSFIVGGGMAATGSSGSPSGVTSAAAGGYSDNAAWQRAAVQALIAAGYDGTTATDALSRYLESQSLTPQQNSLVNIALQRVGPNPDPVPAAPTPPPSTTSGGTQAPSSPPTGYPSTLEAIAAGAKLNAGEKQALAFTLSGGQGAESHPSYGSMIAKVCNAYPDLCSGATPIEQAAGVPPK